MSVLTRTGAHAVQLSRGRRFARWVVEFVPPMVAACAVLPLIISGGNYLPWRPSTIDLQVYVYAVKDLLGGGDIYATTTPGWNLYFIYPPIAAILMVPLAFGPYLFWQLVWTAGWSVPSSRCCAAAGSRAAGSSACWASRWSWPWSRSGPRSATARSTPC